MIQIDYKNAPNTVYFDRNLSDFHPNSLKLRSEVTGTEYEFKRSPDSEQGDYFVYVMSFSGCEDGEYVYTLSDGKREHTGLIHIGTLKPTEKAEYKANNTNIQYKTDF